MSDLATALLDRELGHGSPRYGPRPWSDLAAALERGRGIPPVAAGVVARPCRCDPPGALTGDGEPRCSKCGRAAP